MVRRAGFALPGGHRQAPSAIITTEGAYVFGSLGVPELLVILVIVIVIFGAGKLPQLGRGIGEGIRNFKESLKGDDTKGEDGKNPPGQG